MLKKLTKSGLETFAYYSIQKDEVYVKVRASLNGSCSRRTTSTTR